jgi:cytochrome P450 family 6
LLGINQIKIIFLGFETSSSTMSLCLFELSRNPEVKKKVHEEIDSVLAAHDGEISYDSINDMKYLDCCVDEALRLYPILPMLFRTITKDYKIPNSDTIVEKGTPVYWSIMGIQRDPNIFENPMEFRPERFLNSSNGSGTAKGLFYMPFGDGPRKRFFRCYIKIVFLFMINFQEIASEQGWESFKRNWDCCLFFENSIAN